MTDLSFDQAVAERMGYEDAVAAIFIGPEDDRIEFALLAPGSVFSDDQWVVAIHCGCDPHDDSRGSSGIEDCGRDQEAAEDYYLERIAQYRENLRIDEEVRALNAARP